LVLFALFTAAGTWILSNAKRSAPEDKVFAPTTVAQPSIEPPILKPSAAAIEPATGEPTAAGPLGNKAPRTGRRNGPTKRPPNENPLTATGPAPSPPRVAGSTRQVFPQVQAADPPTAERADDSQALEDLAHLPGFILPAPPQQARHDNNESSLH
jgi:hypothetical protein